MMIDDATRWCGSALLVGLCGVGVAWMVTRPKMATEVIYATGTGSICTTLPPDVPPPDAGFTVNSITSTWDRPGALAFASRADLLKAIRSLPKGARLLVAYQGDDGAAHALTEADLRCGRPKRQRAQRNDHGQQTR